MRASLIAALLMGTLSAAAQRGGTWITNINLVNTETGKLQPGVTVRIDSGRIRSVGRYNPKFKIPDSAKIIEGTGLYLMPGMIDGHIHFFQSGGLYTRPDGLNLTKFYSYNRDQQWIRDNHRDLMRRYLACGITGVVDVGGPFSNFEVRNQNNADPLAPYSWVTGPLISTYLPPHLDEKDPPIIKVNSADEARELVRRQLPHQPDLIKIWYIVLPGQPAAKTLPIVQAAVDESHRNGLKVAVHATEYQTAKLAVEAGCDILVHSIDDRPVDDSLLQLLKKRKVSYIPTAIVASKYNEVFTQQHRLGLHDFTYANPFMLGTLTDLQHLPAKEVGMDYKKMRGVLKIPSREDSLILLNLKKVSDAGICIATGTDAGNVGTQHASSFLAELQAMRKGGMSNARILKAATIDAARSFGREKETGSVEKDKMANLLILRGNPLDSLENVQEIAWVINRGHLIRPDTLLTVTPESLVQQQLNAYNHRNMEAFLAPYSDSVELYEFPGTLFAKGKDQMRAAYKGMFEQVSGLHCEVLSRIVQGNTVIDHERVSGFGPQQLRAIAVYTIENNRIQKVHFIQ